MTENQSGVNANYFDKVAGYKNEQKHEQCFCVILSIIERKQPKTHQEGDRRQRYEEGGCKRDIDGNNSYCVEKREEVFYPLWMIFYRQDKVHLNFNNDYINTFFISQLFRLLFRK